MGLNWCLLLFAGVKCYAEIDCDHKFMQSNFNDFLCPNREIFGDDNYTRIFLALSNFFGVLSHLKIFKYENRGHRFNVLDEFNLNKQVEAVKQRLYLSFVLKS